MSDLISLLETVYSMLQTPISEKDLLYNSMLPNNRIHLCEYCKYDYPECPAEKDNVMKENNEDDLISRRALYDKCVELEQEALKVVLTTDDKIEKLIWNAVLTERSAFKFAVVDAPTSLDNPSAETKQKGKWETVPYKKIEHGEVVIDGDAQLCSVCRHAEKGWNKEMKYCPNCGADMR